jgi:hypothetical protein
MSQFTAKQAFQNVTATEFSNEKYRDKVFDAILKMVELLSLQRKLYYVAKITSLDSVEDAKHIKWIVDKLETRGFDVTVNDNKTDVELFIVWKNAK